MGSKVSVPGPSAEERDLQRQQAELLAQQRLMIERQNQQNLVLLPFLAAQQGFNVDVDPDTGIIRSISARSDPSSDRQKLIQQMLEERTLAALKGELPVDPALEANIQREEETTRNRLLSQLGPGYETSSAGIETLGEFFRNSEMLREGARTGHLTLAEQLGLTRRQQDVYETQSGLDFLRTSAIGDPLQLAGTFGQVARGYGQAQIPYIQNRGMQLNASLAGMQSQNALIGAGIGAIGAYFSDEDIKGDLIEIGSTKEGIPIYVYTRKDTGERMIGVLSSDVEEVYPGAISVKAGYEMVDYRWLD